MNGFTRVSMGPITPQNEAREDAWTAVGGGPLVARSCGVAKGARALVATTSGLEAMGSPFWVPFLP